MNLLVLSLATMVGFVGGFLIWRFSRNLLAAVLTPIALIGIVAAVLPWQSAVNHDQARTPDGKRLTPTLASFESYRPLEVPADGYLGSDACLECHADNHASWFASYHRTMTQLATHDAVLGDFDNVRLTLEGQPYQLRREQDFCAVEMPDPFDTSGSRQRTSMPIVMTTGSHHMQVYWFATGSGRMTGILPFVFWKETGEWIPRSAAFVNHNDGVHFETGRWNGQCSRCHATHRRARYLQQQFDTHVAEFGISCEACHGPGRGHIDFHRSVTSTDSDPPANIDPIVNPAGLTKVRSAQVCGQCHSVMSLKEDASKLNALGHGYRPGADLNETHTVWQRDSANLEDGFGPNYQYVLDQSFYRDGMIRVSGREYNGLVKSACYQRGEMTCLSCHQLHKSDSDPRSLSEWADDQLHPSARGNDACLTCHEASKFGPQHTHHAAGSSGSNCYNCHMPHTAYGLLKAIRNHTISSPNVSDEIAAGRPGACNLCHLDQTLSWSADHLQRWYGIAPPPKLEREQREVAASLLWLLKGNAADRALAAWSLGWSDATSVSGKSWQTPFLAQLLDDPYAAIRLIARRSLRAMPGSHDFDLDVALETTPSQRKAAISTLIQSWQAPSDQQAGRSELLLTPDGIDRQRLQSLLEQRDDQPMNLAE